MVSFLTLHQLVTDEDKIIFYKKVYNALKPNGIFYRRYSLGSNDHIKEIYMKRWKDFMLKSVPENEIENKWLIKYKEEDNPASLIKHIN